MDLLTPKEAAKLLNLPVTWLYARTCESSDLERIPFYRFGRLLRFKKAELVAWAEKQHRNGQNSRIQ